MQQQEVSSRPSITGRIAFALLYGVGLIISVLVVVTQVRSSGVTAAALSISLAGALLAGWQECRTGWTQFRGR